MERARTVALVTYKKEPDLVYGDDLLAADLKLLGIKVAVCPWDDTDINWRQFDAVVLRSCWDYHSRAAEFTRWLNSSKSQKVNLLNTYDLVFWSLHKSYLLDLEAKGVNIVPTVYLKQGSSVDSSTFKEKSWDQVVIKPAIGASGYRLFSGSVNDPKVLEKLEKLATNQDTLVQPLMPEVRQVGEYSSIFFNNTRSHTVLKKPKEGDFRSNYEHGATATVVEPSADVLNELEQILKQVTPMPLYARVDYLISAGRPVLMELELVEPNLYMDLFPQAAKTFAKQISLKLNS